MATPRRRFTGTLAELEARARVPAEDQVQTQPTEDLPHVYVEPEDLDRSRLLSPQSAGRLRPRG